METLDTWKKSEKTNEQSLYIILCIKVKQTIHQKMAEVARILLCL